MIERRSGRWIRYLGTYYNTEFPSLGLPCTQPTAEHKIKIISHNFPLNNLESPKRSLIYLLHILIYFSKFVATLFIKPPNLIITYQIMAPSLTHDLIENNQPGPHPSYIQIAKPYVFQHKMLECITSAGSTEAKDDAIRLQGVAWIDSVRKAMHL